MLWLDSLILLASIFALAGFGNIVVNRAIKIAKLTGIAEITIGFILISVSTSLPELVVSVFSILTGSVGISIGNLLGSNIANICLIFGIGLLFRALIIEREMFKNLSLILLVTSLIPVILLILGELNKIVGLALVLIFVGFCYYSIKMKATMEEETKNRENGSLLITFFGFALGMAGLLISAHFVVESASTIARAVGIPQSVIGGTIIAVGTSLPEMAVDLTAIKKNKLNLAIGDVLGSGMTNLTLILGPVLLLSPFKVNIAAYTCLVIFLVSSNFLFWLFIRKGKLGKFEGLCLLLLYITFLVVLISRI